MDDGADALARRAQRFGKAPAAEEGVEHVDEEARLTELIQLRAQERKEAEQQGVLSTGKTRLEEAKDLVGICPGMISEYQYLWRKLRYNNIHSLEKDEHGVPQWYLTIKDYARSAAGNEQELPSDVRPPDVLLRTTDYLLSHLLSTHPFTAVNQAFIRDRARAIVKDFTMQHVRNAPAIEAHERIVRMAAISMHVFRDQRQPDGPFDHDGERKQFVNALSSLTQFYTDSRTPTLPKTFISPTHTSPNEPELQSYWHAFSIRKPPTLHGLPIDVTTHPLFTLTRNMIKLWDQSTRLIKEVEGMLLSPSERAAKERAEANKGVHRFKRPVTPDPAEAALVEGDEGWKPQRFDYPPTFAFPALALLRVIADPGVPWVLAAVFEASALDELRARALWEIWQVRRGGDVTVLELVEQLGFDTPEDVRTLVDAIAEASGRNVRRLRPKGAGAEVKAYRLVGSMKFPTHFHKVGRNVRLIDSKRPAGLELAQVVNQSWEKSTNGYDLPQDDIPELTFPERIDIEPGDTQPKPALNRLESSRTGTPANATGGGVFAGFGAVGKPGNAFGEAKAGNTFGEGKPVNVFGETKPPNIFGRPESKPSNPFGTASTSSFGVPSANPFGKPATSAPTANPFGAGLSSSSSSASAFGAGASAFGAGSNAFGAGATAFGAGSSAFSAGPSAFGAGSLVASGTKSSEPMKPSPEPTKASQLAKIDSPSGSKLSPFAASFVPKFGLTGSLPVPTPAKPAPVESEVTLDDTSTTQHEEDGTVGVTEEEEEELERAIEEEMARMAEEETARKLVAQQEAAKAAREAKLRDKLEAARKEEEIRKKKAEEERARKQVEEERRRAEEEQRRLEVEQHQLAEERARLEAERLRQLRLETLHSTTAELLFADILEILVVPEVQHAIQKEKQNRFILAKAFEHWEFRVAKRIKRRRVLDNMGLGRVGVAGAAEEVGELFDEDEIEDEDSSFVRERRRISFREERNDADLAAAMAKAAAERERLWAPGVFLDIIKDTVTSVAKQQNKNLDEIQGWDVWLCTSGANKSSAEWLRKKLNARPTQLVDGTVSVVSITPKAHKKESAPGLVVFECSPHLGAAMNDQEWNDAWSGEANRIARLFSAMSNHASYTPSLMFVLWSTDHVAQHSEIITRKLKQAASHLADVSIRGEPAVAVLVDETVEEVFQAALASLELDIDGHQVVERSSVTESLSKQISVWHQSLSSVLSKLPTFDDEVDLNVLRTSLRQVRHSSRPFPARFFCERVAQLVDIAITPSVSGNRPRFEVAAAERVFESALQESLNALEARPKKRMQNESPVRDNKKARLSPRATPSDENVFSSPEPAIEISGAAKLRALLTKTRNRWAESDSNDL
ncbi:SAC3/GANP domain protein associated with nuclear localization of protein [Rhizoctonia solani]|uniref:SAC3/GANP domain protein associated with nuclear localization of protein n=1 Tax=Rhizoctonia solani TaxID=456999 RepID=A0A8H8P0G3_9AGAM|nr:SAC3/GANP domain protein associated with nuclear localization of protein [Rhizoctonia solani]QRW22820.1 SAC3/GANP domain protein associated with nuclear localization of protein [Rhizoctonia solani]